MPPRTSCYSNEFEEQLVFLQGLPLETKDLLDELSDRESHCWMTI